MTKRVALTVYVDLDAVPGTFHTIDSARNSIAGILDGRIPHYKPIVSIADIQPENYHELAEKAREEFRLTHSDTSIFPVIEPEFIDVYDDAGHLMQQLPTSHHNTEGNISA